MEDTWSLKYVLGLCISYSETGVYGTYAGKKRAEGFGFLITASAHFANSCVLSSEMAQ
jgi:hypothetical protein